MIEVKIPKEIMEYREKFLLGLSIRQFLCLVAASLTSVGSYLAIVFALGLPDGFAGYFAMAMCMPLLAVGFLKIDGYNFEKYARVILNYHFGQRVLVYRNSDSDHILEENYARSDKRARSQQKEADMGVVAFQDAKKWSKRARKKCKSATTLQLYAEESSKGGKISPASYKI